MHAPATLSSRHVASLDGLRGIAVLIVLLHHLAAGSLPNAPLGWHLVRNVLYLGWSGVDLFFVLSGFLITGILLDTKDASNYFQSFYARRVLRIFPLYYLVLTAIVLLSYGSHGWWLNSVLPSPHDRPFYFAYLNNWLPLERQGSIIGHFWSLAVEEQFYLVWPLGVWLLPRRRVLPVALLVGVVAPLILRVVLATQFVPSSRWGTNTLTRGLDPLLMGAVLACLVRQRELLVRVKHYVYLGGMLGFAVFAAAIAAGRSSVPRAWGGLVSGSCLALFYGMLILHAFLTSGDKTLYQSGLRNRVFRSFGKYSYGIYVYHVPLLMVAIRLCARKFSIGTDVLNSWIFCVGVIAISYLVAKLSYDLFESRFLKLKRWFAAETPHRQESGTVSSVSIA
jgi:peptidoglycan/LPS O-acetylase OafA/YrhL